MLTKPEVQKLRKVVRGLTQGYVWAAHEIFNGVKNIVSTYLNTVKDIKSGEY